MVPQLRENDQAVEMRPWQDTEVAKADIPAGDNVMQDPIAVIRNPEHGAFQALAAIGKDRRRALHCAHRFQQHGDVFRAILSIGIHDHDGIALPVLLQIG